MSSRNVVAEIVGSETPNEVVVVGEMAERVALMALMAYIVADMPGTMGRIRVFPYSRRLRN